MTTRWHFEQDPFGQTLRIYAFDPDRRLQFTLVDGNGGVRQDVLEEGVTPKPFLEMASIFSGPFIDGFKRFLGERDDLPKDTVPKEIYDREAARVDKMIDFAIAAPPPPTLRYDG